MNPHETLLSEIREERAEVVQELQTIERERSKLRQQDKTLLLQQVEAEDKLRALKALRRRANSLRALEAPKPKRSNFVRVWRLLFG